MSTDPVHERRRIPGAAPAALGMVLALAPAPANAGHEIAYYPSFYPQEITLKVIGPAAAAAALKNNALHAYLGQRPEFDGPVPSHVETVESLEGFVVLEFNPASKAFDTREARCAAGRAVVSGLEDGVEGVALAPYPVTPFHPDYLHHLDRVEAARAAPASDPQAPGGIRIRAEGGPARALAGEGSSRDGAPWDVRLKTVALSALGHAELPLNASPSPPWAKQGWHQAYRLLAGAVSNPDLETNIESAYRRLTRGEYGSLAEQLSLERGLVADLVRECRRLVAGHLIRREAYSADLSGGIENVAYDGQAGLTSGIFVRTAKLKDFPWNGWLTLGMARPANAAFNPVAGFTDPPGRLLWAAVGDSALLPVPYNGSFLPNRAVAERAGRGGASGFAVPGNALTFRPGSGEIESAGRSRFSRAKLDFRVKASVFQDGSAMDAADLLYALAFAYRWSAKADADDAAYDPAVAAATRLMRARLQAIRVLEVARETVELAPDVKYTRVTPEIEVYLDHGNGEALEIAALAPPFSALPWHLTALMEAAVLRGLAAFSKEEAKRRGVPWLDLVRDAGLKARLRALIDQFARKGYRPDLLKGYVAKDEARARWRALGKFAEQHDHLLVTNGPYRLQAWEQDKVVLTVVRELTYPWGVGAFDGYAYPARAIVTDAARAGANVVLSVDLEKTIKVGRRLDTVREPFAQTATRELFRIRADSRYLLLNSASRVIGAGEAAFTGDARFEVALPEDLPAGRYTLLAGVFPDGNRLGAAPARLDFEVAD